MVRRLAGISLIASCAAAAGIAAAQALSGTVTADDTGAPIGGATVVAIQKTVSHAQQPAIYWAGTDSAGRYAMTVSAGQYQLCVHGAGVYLNPCEWGAGNRTVPVSAAATADLRLKKGAWLIVRIHDRERLMPHAETVRGGAVTAFVAGGTIPQFPLPLIYDHGSVRDYGAVVPMNLAMRARVVSASLVLNDSTGVPLGAEGVPFQVTAADFPANTLPREVARMFPRATAKFIHVYTAGQKPN